VILFKTQIFHGALAMGPGLPSAGKSVVLFKGSPAGLTGRRCMFTVLLRDKWGSDVPCILLDVRVRCVAAADPAAQIAEQLEVTKSQKNLAATASSADRMCHEVWAVNFFCASAPHSHTHHCHQHSSPSEPARTRARTVFAGHGNSCLEIHR